MFDYIFAGDVEEGLLRLAQSEAGGIVNLGTGSARRVREVVSILKKEFPSLKIKKIPLAEPFESSDADVSTLRKMTGWQPKMRLEKGISELIRYERASGRKA